MYSAHIEGKSVAAERLIRTLKNTIYKYLTSISKKVYIDKLDLVNKCSNAYHSTVKVNPVDIKSKTYIDSGKEINEKVFLQNVYVPNWSEEVFVIKKVKNTVLWTYVINDLNGEEIVGTF